MLNEYQEIEKYIENCNMKSKKHHTNSLNSRKWKNSLEFFGGFIASTASLTMPLLSLSGSDSMTIAIVGNAFIFCGTTLNILSKVFGFAVLEHIHGHLSNEFSDLESEFANAQRRNSVGNYNNDDMEKLIIRYQSICSRANVQGVKECNFCCCYR